MLTVDINQKEKKGISFVLDYLNDKKNHDEIKEVIAEAIQNEVQDAKSSRRVVKSTSAHYRKLNLVFSLEGADKVLVFPHHIPFLKQLDHDDQVMQFDNYFNFYQIDLNKKVGSKTFAAAFENSSNLDLFKDFVQKIIFKDLFKKVSESLIEFQNKELDYQIISRFQDSEIPFAFLPEKERFIKSILKLKPFDARKTLKMMSVNKNNCLSDSSFESFNKLRLDFIKERLFDQRLSFYDAKKILTQLCENGLVVGFEPLIFGARIIESTAVKGLGVSASTKLDDKIICYIEPFRFGNDFDSYSMDEFKKSVKLLIDSSLQQSGMSATPILHVLDCAIENNVSFEDDLDLDFDNFSKLFFKDFDWSEKSLLVKEKMIQLFPGFNVNLKKTDLSPLCTWLMIRKFCTDPGTLLAKNKEKIWINNEFLENCLSFANALDSNQFVFSEMDDELKEKIFDFCNFFKDNAK